MKRLARITTKFMLGFTLVFHLAAHARAADPIDVDAAKNEGQSRLYTSTPIETANRSSRRSKPRAA